MGPLGWIVVASIVGVVIYKTSKKKAQKKLEKQQRLSQPEIEAPQKPEPPCGFSDGITQELFEMIAKVVVNDVKRISETTVDGSDVYCTVRSNSKLSEWSFKIDFNDFGHLTGRYWITSDNEDSNIPKYVAENIRGMILSYPEGLLRVMEKNNGNNDADGLQYCPYCGRKNSYQNPKYCTYCGAKLQ